eukprot:4319153-Alexandrium_andersonii.AAC.1
MAWRGPAPGLHQTGTGGPRASHGLAKPGCGAAPAPLAIASLGWGLAGRGVIGCLNNMDMLVGSLGPCLEGPLPWDCLLYTSPSPRD